MKLPPDSIAPKLYCVEYPDGVHYLLACARRIFKSGASQGPSNGRAITPKGREWKASEVWDHVLFPAMVELPIASGKIDDSRGVSLRYGVSGDDRKWTIFPVSIVGMSEHSAACAIAEAWRGVDESKLDLETMLPFHTFDTDPVAIYKGGTARWMVNAWVRWDSWNARGYNNPQRAKQLQKLGFKIDAKRIENAASIRQMPKALKD
jgi:hypothetical protein